MMTCAAMKVLIVDDRPSSLKLLRAVLEADGASVIEAKDGVDAISLLKQVRVDAVISDILMPRMDGYRLCMEMRASSQTYDLPFIAYTASYTATKDEQLMMDVGADRFLRKPVSAALLTFTLGQVVKSRRRPGLGERPRSQAELLKACNQQLTEKLNEKNLELAAQGARPAQPEAGERGAELQWMQMFATALNALFIVQDEKMALASSSAARLLAAVSVHELAGTSIAKLFSAAEWSQVMECAGVEAETPARARPLGGQNLRRLGGEMVAVEIAAGRIEYLGRPAWLIEARDLSDQKLLLGRLKQTQRWAVLGSIAGGIVHDFNNSLAGIQSSCELARGEAAGNSAVIGHLDALMAGAQHASALARRVLASLNEQAAELSPVALRRIVLDAATLLRAVAPVGIEIRTSLGIAPLVILADETQVHRILMNLGVNALRAMARPGGCLMVVLEMTLVDSELVLSHSTLPPGPYALLTFGDSGHGMDAETLRRVFEPFFTTNPPGEGSGLGLTVVNEIVQTHRGAISVVSDRGVGTTFRVYFPLCSE